MDAGQKTGRIPNSMRFCHVPFSGLPSDNPRAGLHWCNRLKINKYPAFYDKNQIICEQKSVYHVTFYFITIIHMVVCFVFYHCKDSLNQFVSHVIDNQPLILSFF
jgi:hypothetical protein